VQTRGIRILGTALSVLLLAGGNTYASNEENEKATDKEIVELMNEFPTEALYESIGIEEERISIFDLEDLANMVGTASETVIRVLSDFKDEKLIDIQSGKIYVINTDRLVIVAERNFAI